MADDTLSPVDPRDIELAALRQRVAELERAALVRDRDLAIGRSLLAGFPGGFVFVFDQDLRYLKVTGTAPARGNVSQPRVVGYTLYEVFPNIAAQLEASHRAAFDGKTTTTEVSFGGGDYRMTVLPVYDHTKQIIAGMTIVFDITEQIAAESQVRIFEQLVANAPDGILVRKFDGTLTYANPALQMLLGYDESLVDMHIAAIVAPLEQSQLPIIGQQLEAHESWSGRLAYQRKDRTTFPVQLTVFPIVGGATDTPMVGAIIRDVTAEDQAIQEREALQEQVITAQEAAIRELATPLIPVADGILVMPLIGLLDTRRVQQVLEILLEGIVAHQADVAILDITGVKIVDTQVAQAILRVTQATKLLGAQVIITGVGASIALTLTQIGANLAEIITVGTLQQGIALALSQRDLAL